MENANAKEQNEIFINFNNENNEFDHDYTKPFSRSKSIIVKNTYTNEDSFKSDTYKSKKSNKNDESYHLNNIKKEFYNLSCEFNIFKNNFNKNIVEKELSEQNDFVNLFCLTDKQNILLKEILPYLSSISESSKENLNDKLKNNFINKIYELETKLSDKEDQINKMTDEIQKLKIIISSNNFVELENKSEKTDESNASSTKNSYNGFVNIARNSIYSSIKFPNINTSHNKFTNENNHSEKNYDEIILNSSVNSNQLKEMAKNDIDITKNNNLENNKNNKPEFYQRKKNNLIDEEQRSKSFCLANEQNQSLSTINVNICTLNEIEDNQVSNKKNLNNTEGPKINSFNEEENFQKDNKDKISTQKDISNKYTSERNDKNKSKTRGRNISLPNFNDLNNLQNKENLEREIQKDLYDENKKITNDKNNDSLVDIAFNENIEKGNDKPYADDNDEKFIGSLQSNSPEIINIGIDNKQSLKLNRNINIGNQEILNKIKDNFLSLSSCDNSLNSSLNNISNISSKSGNKVDKDLKSIKRYKSLFKEKNNDISEEDLSINSFSNKRKSQNFSYLNLLINNKNLKNTNKESGFYYDSNNKSTYPEDLKQPNGKEFEYSKEPSSRKLNMKLISDTLKINTNMNSNSIEGNLISNSPLHHNMDDINNQLTELNYVLFKDNSNDIYYDPNINTTKIKSKSVVIKNRSNQDISINIHNSKNNYLRTIRKLDKKFAEDDYLIKSKKDVSTEPIKNINNEKLCLQNLSLDINLENTTKILKMETTKNKKISTKFIKDTLFKYEDEVIEILNLNSEESQGGKTQIRKSDILIPEQKEELNFSFNNSQYDIESYSKKNLSLALDINNYNNDKITKLKNVKKISLLRIDKNNHIKKKEKLSETKTTNKVSKSKSNFDYIEENKDCSIKLSKDVKSNNPCLNNKFTKDFKNNSIINKKEFSEQSILNSSIITKSKEYSKNIKALNDKNIKKNNIKTTNVSKANLENNKISINSSIINDNLKNNDNKNNISSVKMRKNYIEKISQSKNNLNKKSNMKLNNNENYKNSFKNKDQVIENLDNIFKNSNLNNEKNISALITEGKENDTTKKLTKKTKFSKSTCELKTEIYLKINKDAVFSLKPDEFLNLSENEYLSNKESSKDENDKATNENVFSLENEINPSDKKSNNLIKESCINKINEHNNKCDSKLNGKINKKLTLSNKDQHKEKINKNESCFDRANKENDKRLSSRSKSFVEFDNKSIKTEKMNESSYLENKKNIINKNYSKKEKYQNLKNNDDIFNKINESNKTKIEMITGNKNKNREKEKEKTNLESSLNESTKSNNQTQNSISFNFINNININASGNSSLIIENNDKPVTYTKKLLAKYYKYVDDYNKKITNESNITSKYSILNDSKTSKSINKK